MRLMLIYLVLPVRNFRTDLYEPHWSYMLALDRGWIPRGNLQDQQFLTACSKEDLGEFKCLVSPYAPDKAVRGGVEYALHSEGKDSDYIYNMSGKVLKTEADKVLNQYWQAHHSEGVTCDFGGIAFLFEQNRTFTDDDSTYDDDEYVIYEQSGVQIATLIGIIFLVSTCSGLFGFVVAMRVNRGFNHKVQQSKYFKPLSKSSLIRSSLMLDELDSGYTEIPAVSNASK